MFDMSMFGGPAMNTVGVEDPTMTGFTEEEAAIWRSCMEQIETLTEQRRQLHNRMVELRDLARKRVEDEESVTGLDYDDARLVHHLVKLCQSVGLDATSIDALRREAVEAHVATHLSDLSETVLTALKERL